MTSRVVLKEVIPGKYITHDGASAEVRIIKDGVAHGTIEHSTGKIGLARWQLDGQYIWRDGKTSYLGLFKPYDLYKYEYANV